MIPRYTRTEIGNIWSDDNKFRKWLDVELAVLDALSYYRYIPKNIPGIIRKKAKLNPERILKIEETVKHDVIAFLTNISESVGSAARFVHYGMTSSDMLDTGLALQIKEASGVLEEGLGEGATEADLLDAYPRLTEQDIRAALAYAADSLAHETIILEAA